MSMTITARHGYMDDPDRRRWSKDTEHLATYEYRRADGRYAFEIWKGQNPDGQKVFRLRRCNMLQFSDRLEPEDRVDYYYNLGNEPPVLYRLPELIAATKLPGTIVFIMEGEKDVETARGLGLTATCNPFGALKWRNEYSAWLTGCDVVVCQDNDEVGRNHAAKVVASVQRYAQRVRIWKFLDLPEHGDFTDWVERRRATERRVGHGPTARFSHEKIHQITTEHSSIRFRPPPPETAPNLLGERLILELESKPWNKYTANICAEKWLKTTG